MSRKVLLVDDNPAILEIMTLYVESCDECEILTASSGNEAIEILKQQKDIQLVISDFNMPNGNGGDVYSFLREYNSKMPFVLQTAEPIEILDEFDGFPDSGKDQYLQKPFSCTDVTGIIDKLLSIESVEENPDRYIKVAIPTFKKYSNIGVDAFLKLSETKFVKFHHHDDELDNLTLTKYESKGIAHFYIKKNDYQRFIESCQSRLKDVLLSPNISPHELESAQFDTAENLKNAIKTLGVDDFLLEQADQLTKSIIQNIPKSQGIEGLLGRMRAGNQYLTQLSLMVGYVAVAIADEISWADKKVYEKLATAAVFMDLAWMEMESDVKPEWCEVNYRDDLRMKSLGQSEQKMIKQHSVNSAKLYDKIQFDSDIYNLICDHHERPEGRGFPKGIFEQQISSLAAIFTISHEFCSRILQCKKFNLEQYTKIKQGILIEFKEGKYKEPCRAFATLFC